MQTSAVSGMQPSTSRSGKQGGQTSRCAETSEPSCTLGPLLRDPTQRSVVAALIAERLADAVDLVIVF